MTIKRLLLLAIPVVVLLAGPWVIPVLAPGSAINCRLEEINIKTGQARYSRYIWFVKVAQEIEDTILSEILCGEPVEAADVEPWHKVATLSGGSRYSPHYKFHGALFQTRLLERVFEMSGPEGERRREVAREVLRLWQTTGDDEGASSYLYRVSKADSWTDGRWSRGLAPLPLALPTIGGSSSNSAALQAASDIDKKYCQAVEFYQLLSEQGTDYYSLREKHQNGSLSEPQRKALARVGRLLRSLSLWGLERPDTDVADEDYSEVGALVTCLCHDPNANTRLKSRLGNPDRYDVIQFDFYTGRRCCVRFKQLYGQSVEDRRPVGGVDLYLVKYEGQWRLIHRSDWIS